MPCSRRGANETGEKCPYHDHEPETHEGQEAWDILMRCERQVRINSPYVVGLDLAAALMMAEALGYDKQAAAELLPSCETGMLIGINTTKEKDGEPSP